MTQPTFVTTFEVTTCDMTTFDTLETPGSA